MQLQDLSFRFALLETDLYDIESDRSKKPQPHPLRLPQHNITAEHLLFIKERLSCIHDKLGAQESKPLSPKSSALLPPWCEKCSAAIDALVQASCFRTEEDKKEIAKLADETKKRVEKAVAQCAHFQKGLQETPAPPSFEANIGFYARISARVGSAVQKIGSYFGKKAEEAAVWLSKAPQDEAAAIEEKQRDLRISSEGPVAASFAAAFSDYLVSYLEEHVLHIEEREVELRPEFLKNFFVDPYVPHPVPTVLGKSCIAALSSNREDIKKMLEMNVLIFLDNVYSKMGAAFTKSPYALTSLVHDTLAETIQEVKKDEQGPVLDSMGLTQRNMLLSGQVTKQLVEKLLKMGFPGGAASLHIPSKTLSFFGRDVLWSLIEEASSSTLRDRLVDMSAHADIQEELLLKGYRELNGYLTNKSPEERRRRRGGGRQSVLVEFIVIIFSSFFSALGSSIFNARRPGGAVETLYPAHEDLAHQIQAGFSSLLPDTWGWRKVKAHIGPKIAATMAPQLAERLREFGGKPCINDGLERVQSLLRKNFPRTQKEKSELLRQEQEERAARRKELKEEELAFKNNLPALAKKIVENCGFSAVVPSKKEFQEMLFVQRWFKKVDLFLRKFINACFEKMVFALFRIIDLPKQADRSARHLHELAEKVPQDAFVTFMMDWVCNNPGNLL